MVKRVLLAVTVALVAGCINGFRTVLQTTSNLQVATKDDEGRWTANEISVPGGDCGYFVMEPGKMFGYRSFVTEIDGCPNLKVSKLFMDRSCASSRDGGPTGVGSKLKIWGKQVLLDKTDNTFYACFEESTDDDDVIRYEQDNAASLQPACFEIEEENPDDMVGLEKIKETVDSGVEYDSGNICARIVKSNYAIVFINNRQCKDKDAKVKLSVSQSDYSGRFCPSKGLTAGAIVGIVLALAVVGLCFIYCIVRNCCCCK